MLLIPAKQLAVGYIPSTPIFPGFQIQMFKLHWAHEYTISVRSSMSLSSLFISSSVPSSLSSEEELLIAV